MTATHDPTHDPATEFAQQGDPTPDGMFARVRRSIHHLKRFGITSALSFGVVTGGTALLREGFGLSAQAAFGIALVTVFIFNFILLRRYVFPGQVHSVHRQFVATAIVSVCFRSLEYGAFLILVSWLGVQYLIASVMVLILSFIAKFVVLKTFVFEHQPRQDDDNPVAAAPTAID